MASTDFFASKKAAAVFKHGILSRYPVVFASKTGKSVEGNRVVFLDGYAGRGEYGDGQPGSPLLLSRCAEFVKGYRNVLGFFVEQNPDNFANLKRVLDEKGGDAERIVRCGSVDEHLPEVLTRAQGASLFAFLDPFGPALDYDVLKAALLGRPSWPPTEVLLHFSVSAVARMGRAVQVARSKRGDLSPADQKTADRLNRFLGDDWWQDHFARVRDEGDDQRATEIALEVCERYEKLLTAGTEYQAIKMPVRPRPDLLPKYVLALFTTSNEGAWHFADSLGKAGVEWSVAWKTEQLRKGEKYGQGSLFGDDELPTIEGYSKTHSPEWTKIIKANLERLLDERGSFCPADHVPEVYGTTLGQAGTPHVRAAVKLLSGTSVANTGKGDFWKEQLRRP
ncbi:three-Cys-motif partner protein TcmP [Micromonospora sp. NPDC052213]|uniref:three-Cys-motif partner protein TcmP n=1 Tax=Micromonospora sp. NPDC052213 TaxID=3155812 RepID=UPI003418965C